MGKQNLASGGAKGNRMSNITADYFAGWDKRALEFSNNLLADLQAFADELELSIAQGYWQAHGYTIHHDGTATKSGRFLSERDVLEQWRNRDEVVPF